MSPLRRRLAAAAAGALMVALSGTAVAASQLFKCVEGGRTVYQQQPCAGAAAPESVAGGHVAKPASTPVQAASAPPRRVRSPSLPSSAPAAPR